MFLDYPPDQENTRGARWNPSETPAIYTSLSREVAIAEADFQISLEPFRPRVKRTVYRVRVALANVLNLSDHHVLQALGVGDAELRAFDHRACQTIGGAAEWLGHDGLLVPSARATGTNLVVFPRKQGRDCEFEVLDYEVLDPGLEHP